MVISKKSSTCPIVEELAAIEKMNQAFDKRLAKDAASCSKKLELATKKIKKFSENKSKALAKKKEVASKNKAKSTAALKNQLVKASLAVTKANDALTVIKEEVTGLKIVNQKKTKIIKRRQAETKLIAKFRQGEAKKEAKKLKNKSKPKVKTKRPKIKAKK